MITIDLLGGLGNQLFQYALGRSLEHDLNFPGRQIQFNTCRLESDRGRTYLLGSLGLNLLLTRERPGRAFYEESLRYRSDVLMLQGDVSLCGYWQCEEYFNRVRRVILGEVFRGMHTSDQTRRVADEILSHGDKSCFLHVRRSDNLSPRAVMYHGLTCAKDNTYYERAKAHMRNNAGPGVHFFVFSEDPEWITEHMTEADMTVVTHNPGSFTWDNQGVLTKHEQGRECEDLFLMSLCRHGIMANSTFSWWGAWLNRYHFQDRIVTTPDPWFATKDADSTDIIPQRWLKIPMR